MESPLKIGVLLSGRGTNCESILQAVENKTLDVEVAIVLSNKPDAKGLSVATSYGVQTRAFSPSEFESKIAYEEALVQALKDQGVGLVVLAGYMRIIGPSLLKAFPNQIINIHPSLLPSFRGLNAQKQALDHGVKIAGCTVHFVDEVMDNGAILLQSSVPIHQGDSEADLSQRILEQEHKLLPQAIQLIAEGRVEIVGRKVRLSKK